MQTFLPYPDFEKTAKCLDYRRLGKQRVEAYQILKCLIIKESRWYHHPAVLMWKGYEGALAQYAIAICNEWIKRGYKDTLRCKILEIIDPTNLHDDEFILLPWWFDNKYIYISHQSNLVRKFPEHYQKYFPGVSNDIPYYWPTKQK